MPLYYYECPNADCPVTTVGLIRKVDERDDEAMCPECQAGLRRELGAPLITIGGTGVYKSGTF